ncbi:MAG: DUF5777 family beta-barrel protein [Bacteroidota bacterium]|nr:DUF5777 family beta-barrel protein [Bacteroidota bacterium]
MKKSFIILQFILALTANAWAQEDLLGMLASESDNKPVPVFATFKSTRVVNGQSIEHVAAKHLNFVILHRFGEVNGGAYQLWGLDQANIRLAFDYGITDKIQVGFARSSFEKTYDGNLKIKLLRQSKGKGGMPVSLGYYGNVAVNTLSWDFPQRQNFFTSRLSYVNQIIVAKKFSDKLSLQLVPTLVHYNLVRRTADPNTIFALGTAASFKLNRSVRLNLEYYPRLNGRDVPNRAGQKRHDYLGVGFDIETGGHVFQLMLSNSLGMLEQHQIAETTGSWENMAVRLGFNVSRTFSFDKK